MQATTDYFIRESTVSKILAIVSYLSHLLLKVFIEVCTHNGKVWFPSRQLIAWNLLDLMCDSFHCSIHSLICMQACKHVFPIYFFSLARVRLSSKLIMRCYSSVGYDIAYIISQLYLIDTFFFFISNSQTSGSYPKWGQLIFKCGCERSSLFN